MERFGTALEPVLVFAIIAHPLTVWRSNTGTFFGYSDTVRCVELAIANPAEPGQLRVFKSILQNTLSIGDLAMMVKKAGNAMGLNVKSIT